MNQPTPINITAQDVQIIGMMLTACKQGMMAELQGQGMPVPPPERAKYLAEAIEVADRFLQSIQMPSPVITPQGNPAAQ